MKLTLLKDTTRLHSARTDRRRLLGSVALWCLVAAPAIAQTPAADIEEIVVTGTSIRGEAPVGSTIITLQRVDVEAIGAATTADLLASIPQMNSFNQTPRVGPFGSGSGTPPSLRSIGTDATLVLLDGYTVTPGGGLQSRSDPSALPPIAIERVEVVPDGGSATYGSDAIAGVINIITRKDLQGGESSIRKGWGRGGYNMLDMAQSLGHMWTTGSAIVTVSYSEHSELKNSDTSFYIEDLRPFGGNDLRSTNCAPANIVIGGVTYAAPTYTAGPANRCQNASEGSVVTQNRRYAVVGNAHQEIGENLDVWLRGRYTTNYDGFFAGLNAVNLTIPNTNPFFKLPAGVTATSETVQYNLGPIQGNPKFRFAERSGNLVTGADYKLGGWKLQASLNYGWGSGEANDQQFNTTALNAAAAGTTTATALDPFGNGTSLATKNAITNWRTQYNAKHRLLDLEFRADGPVYDLPGGEIKVAVGASYKRRKFDPEQRIGPYNTDTSHLGPNHNTRKIGSGWGEVFVPIVGPDNARPGLEKLVFDVAVRYDHYNYIGGTTNPKYGATYSPIEGFNIHGNYSTSFHAPLMGDAFSLATRANFQPLFSITPPGVAPLPAIQLSGSDITLGPESAKTYSVGGDYSPPAIPGLRAAISYYNIKYQDVISTPPLNNTLFSNPGFANLYIFNPTAAQITAFLGNIRLEGFTLPTPVAPQLLIDLRKHNFAGLNNNGLDLSLSYRWTTEDYGSFVAEVNGNHIITFDRQGSPGVVFTPDRTIPRNNGRAQLQWAIGGFRASTAVNYTSSFFQTYATPAGQTVTQKVHHFLTQDAAVTYEVPAEGYLSGITLSLNIINITAANPPRANISGGYFKGDVSGYSGGASPLGRLVWIGFNKKW